MGRHHLKVVDCANYAEWRAVSENCEHATFFHTPQWSTYFATTYDRMTIETKKFVFDDGTTAILPLIKDGGVFKSNVEGV